MYTQRVSVSLLRQTAACSSGTLLGRQLGAFSHGLWRGRLVADVLFAFMVIVGLSAKLSPAATIYAYPKIIAAYDLDGTPTAISPDLGQLPQQSRVFEAALFLEVSNLSPAEQGFGNMAFDLSLGGNLRRASAPFPTSYSPSLLTINHDGSNFTPDLPLFADNSDFGDPDDLLDIVVGIDPSNLVVNDKRLKTGIGLPVQVGTIFFEFDALSLSTTGTLQLSISEVSMVSGGMLESAIEPVLIGESTTFSSVPEPSTAWLLAIGAAALAYRARNRSNSCK